jgi:hypothetical protein
MIINNYIKYYKYHTSNTYIIYIYVYMIHINFEMSVHVFGKHVRLQRLRCLQKRSQWASNPPQDCVQIRDKCAVERRLLARVWVGSMLSMLGSELDRNLMAGSESWTQPRGHPNHPDRPNQLPQQSTNRPIRPSQTSQNRPMSQPPNTSKLAQHMQTQAFRTST